jgi:peroxiredoxin
MKRLIRAGAVIAATLFSSNAAALEVGAAAPDFTAVSTRGKITLSQVLMNGPVVLALYYADFTSG